LFSFAFTIPTLRPFSTEISLPRLASFLGPSSFAVSLIGSNVFSLSVHGGTVISLIAVGQVALLSFRRTPHQLHFLMILSKNRLPFWTDPSGLCGTVSFSQASYYSGSSFLLTVRGPSPLPPHPTVPDYFDAFRVQVSLGSSPGSSSGPGVICLSALITSSALEPVPIVHFLFMFLDAPFPSGPSPPPHAGDGPVPLLSPNPRWMDSE